MIGSVLLKLASVLVDLDSCSTFNYAEEKSFRSGRKSAYVERC